MNHDDRSNTSGESDDEPLDRMLQGASWPDSEPERIERLWREWLDCRRLTPRRIWLPLAAAAIVLLAVGTEFIIWNQPRLAPAIVKIEPPPAEPVSIFPGTPQPLVESRPPTSYELLLLAAATQRLTDRTNVDNQSPRAASPEPQPAPTATELVGQILDTLVADAKTDIDQLAAPIETEIVRSACERELIENVRQEVGPRQLAAIQLLGHIGSWRSLPLLMALADRPDTHSSAIPGVARLADPVMLARMANAEPDVDLQRQLLAALLERGRRDAVAMFMKFATDRRTESAAFDSLDLVTDPPIELLFELLDNPHYPTRLAAARVLGRLDGPVITDRLASMVMHGVHRREALVAMLTSPSERAAEFVSAAERHAELSASVRSVRLQLQTLD